MPPEIRQEIERLLSRMLRDHAARSLGAARGGGTAMNDKIRPNHLARKAVLYVRQSSAYQVTHNLESQRLQYAMRDRLGQLGWNEIEIVDEDLGRSAAGMVARSGFERMVAEVCMGKVGAVAAREVSRFARNSRVWQQLVEGCRVVDRVLVDQDTVYAPRMSNDRLLLGLKGSEYELDLLRQRSVEARRQKARRGELLIISPVGCFKGEQRLEKDPDRRVREVARGELLLDAVLALEQPVHRRVQVVFIGVDYAELHGERRRVPPARGGELR